MHYTTVNLNDIHVLYIKYQYNTNKLSILKYWEQNRGYKKGCSKYTCGS